MSVGTPRHELNSLRKFLREIEEQFLARHIGAPTLSAPSKAEVLDVAAYVVLAHGALENYVEGVCLWAINRIKSSWVGKKRATRSLASFLLYVEGKVPDSATSRSVFDTIRMALDEAQTAHSKLVNQNNGIAISHLRDLFRPTGIDIPEDPVLVASVEALVKMRHEWAHQYRFGARTVKSAADARSTVQECLEFAKRLATKASAARP